MTDFNPREDIQMEEVYRDDFEDTLGDTTGAVGGTAVA